MGQATEEQLNNPLHGVKLVQILEHLVAHYGWEEMARRVNINCFKTRPTIKSSLRFLRRTQWAREKVEDLYVESLPKKSHPSVAKMWEDFIAANPDEVSKIVPESWYFSDNEKDAKKYAELVVKGLKKATFSSLWWFDFNETPLPQPGDTYIITDWYGIAKAIIRTQKVEKIAFNQLTEDYKNLEGERDELFADWQKAQWNYYSQEMEAENEQASEEMLIICERFETLWDHKRK